MLDVIRVRGVDADHYLVSKNQNKNDRYRNLKRMNLWVNGKVKSWKMKNTEKNTRRKEENMKMF